MRQTPPHALTFVASTAQGSAFPEWSSATAYTTGQQVKVTPGATINAAGGSASADRTIELTGVQPAPAYMLAGTVCTVTVDGEEFSYTTKIRDTLAVVTKKLALALTLSEVYSATSSATGITITDGAGTSTISFSTTAPVVEFDAAQGSTNKPPATNSAYWTRRGVSNEYKLLDSYVNSQTEGVGSFITSVKVPYRFDKIYLFSLEGVVSVRVRIINSQDLQVYDVTHSLGMKRNVATWWDFFFSPIKYAASADLSIPGVWYPATVEITFNGNSGAEVKCGMVIIGSSIYLGATQWDASASITDYSTKETNDFGETEFVERAFVNELSYDLEVPIGNEDLVYNQLSAMRAIPCVYDGNPDNAPRPLEMLRTFGTCDFEVLLKTHNGTFCSLDIRGLI